MWQWGSSCQGLGAAVGVQPASKPEPGQRNAICSSCAVQRLGEGWVTAGSHRAQELVTEMVLSVETDFIFLADTERKKAPCLLCASHLPTASAARGQDDQKDEPGAGDFPQEPSHACPSSQWSPQTSWQRERGRAAAVLRPYQSHLLAGTQSTTPGDTKSRDRLLMAGVRVLPRIPSLLRVSESSQHTDELTAVRPTCCFFLITFLFSPP